MDWAGIGALLVSIITVGLMLYKAQDEKRKVQVETDTLQTGSLQSINKALAEDNQRLRENLARFDEELSAIRSEMATMRREYEQELTALKIAQEHERRVWHQERQRLHQCVQDLVEQLTSADLVPCCTPYSGYDDET